jgi:hypothetical protein
MAQHKKATAQIKKNFEALINSTIEGETGEWDCSTEEGREAFGDMRELLYEIIEFYGVEISKDEIKEA